MTPALQASSPSRPQKDSSADKMLKPDVLTEDLMSERSSLGIRKARQSFLVNVSSNLAFVLVQTVANLWLTPYLIHYLGIAVFGMVPLVSSLVSYMAILGTAHHATVSRFLAIELEHGEGVSANKTFNTALFATIGAILALGPLILVISFVFSTLFHVPPGWERDAGWLFAIVGMSFFVTTVSNNFGVSPFIHSRFLWINIVNLVALLARMGLMFALFSLFRARLWYVGAGILTSALISLVAFALLWRKLTPELHVQIKAFDRSRLGALTGMGGWVAVNTVGAMLLGGADLLIVNAFFGAAMTGGYASAAQFSALMQYLVGTVGGVIRPVILIRYAQGDLAGLRDLSSRVIRLLGFALALPVGLLCGFSRPLLTVWLGPSFGYLSVLLVVIVCHLSLNLSVRPLLDVQNAFNKVRWPGIVTLLSGGLDLGLAVALATWGKWGATGVAVACAVAWTAKNGFYVPIYTARIMKLPWWAFLPSLSASVIGTLFVGIASYGLASVRMPGNWFTLAYSAALVSLVYAAVVWAIGLSRADRQLLKDLYPLRAAGTKSVLPTG